MKEKQKLMFNRKYEKEKTPREELNRLRSENRKLTKQNKRLKSELTTLEKALRLSIERIEELTDEFIPSIYRSLTDGQEDEEEAEEAEDIPSS